MARLSKTGGKTSKAKARKASPAKGRKTAKTKRRIAPAATRRKRRSVSDLTKELGEALARQEATAEILKVISSSSGDLQPVFKAMLSNALEICEAKFGQLLLFNGEGFDAAELHNSPSEYAELFKNGPLRPGPNTGLGRVIKNKEVVHIPDVMGGSAFTERDPLRVATVDILKARTLLAVPMLKDKELVGSIVIYRQEVRPFSEKQIELVTGFANQAVIAIENARLLNELRERTDDLTESLEQQTATSEVLKVISSSPGELEPVFQAMLENAVRICGAGFGNLFLYEGDGFRVGATHGAPPAYVDYMRSEPVFYQNPEVGLGRLLKTKKLYHLTDIAAAPKLGDKLREATINLAGARTLMGVPMLKDDKVIGAIVIYRKEVRPFTDKQIELVQNFAAQAVIAIENTRLLKELRQRTDDLSESLQQQTATADVLKVISRSTFDLQTVLQTTTTKRGLTEHDEGPCAPSGAPAR